MLESTGLIRDLDCFGSQKCLLGGVLSKTATTGFRDFYIQFYKSVVKKIQVEYVLEKKTNKRFFFPLVNSSRPIFFVQIEKKFSPYFIDTK